MRVPSRRSVSRPSAAKSGLIPLPVITRIGMVRPSFHCWGMNTYFRVFKEFIILGIVEWVAYYHSVISKWKRQNFIVFMALMNTYNNNYKINFPIFTVLVNAYNNNYKFKCDQYDLTHNRTPYCMYTQRTLRVIVGWSNLHQRKIPTWEVCLLLGAHTLIFGNEIF